MLHQSSKVQFKYGVLVLFYGLLFPVLSNAFPIPDIGQITCYDGAGNIYARYDGNYETNSENAGTPGAFSKVESSVNRNIVETILASLAMEEVDLTLPKFEFEYELSCTDTAMPDPVVVSLDRPFIFLIRDEATKAILFMGRVLDPAAE